MRENQGLRGTLSVIQEAHNDLGEEMNQLKEESGDTQRHRVMLRTSLNKQEREIATLRQRCASLQDQVELGEEARIEERKQAEMASVRRQRARSARRGYRPPSEGSEGQEDSQAGLWPSAGRV